MTGHVTRRLSSTCINVDTATYNTHCAIHTIFLPHNQLCPKFTNLPSLIHHSTISNQSNSTLILDHKLTLLVISKFAKKNTLKCIPWLKWTQNMNSSKLHLFVHQNLQNTHLKELELIQKYDKICTYHFGNTTNTPTTKLKAQQNNLPWDRGYTMASVLTLTSPSMKRW